MSFLSPIFLLALGAAALPVVFHLVRRMKAKTVPFGSLMFLKATPKEVVRKRRLRDLLLMATRMVLLALLALVFARPYVAREHLPFVPAHERRSVVLLVDQSFSMRYGGAFDAARAAARARLDGARAGDAFAVVAFDDDARVRTGFDAEAAVHRRALDGLAPGYRTTDYDRALRHADALLRDAPHDARTIVLLSDFQSGGWQRALEDWDLSPGTVFEPVDVGVRPAANAYVADVHLTQRRAGGQVVLRYDARVGAQDDDRRPAAMRLALDGAEDEQPLAARTATFQRTARRAGTYQGTLALPADDLPGDDTYYFTHDVTPRPSILAVDAPAGVQARDAFFLRHAFDLGDAARYAFAAGGPERLLRPDLEAHGLVFASHPGAVQGAAGQRLAAYVAGGGTLVLSFGGADAAAFGPFLQALGVGRVTGVVDARAAQGQEAFIGEVDARHPVFSVFAEGAAAAILQPRFRRYARVAPDSGAVVLGAYDTGDPFLVEQAVDRGRVLVYTSSLSTAWTDFPVDELYVPFVYQLVRYGLAGREAPRQYTVGDVVPLRGRPGAVWEVRAPGDRVHRVALDERGAGFFRETDAPGHYRAADGGARFLFSVNVDPRESDLAWRDPEELYAAVAPPAAHAGLPPARAAALAVEDEEQRQKLWRVLLLLALAVFAFETYYANRPQRHTGAPSGKPRDERGER